MESQWSMSPRLCTRAHLRDYYKMFFPSKCSVFLSKQKFDADASRDFLVCHLRQTAVDQLLEKTIVSHSKHDFKIAVSCGRRFTPMRLEVAEFTPANDQFITVPLISSDNGRHVFETQNPAPVALRAVEMVDLMARCKRHAESMAKKLHSPSLITKEGMENIPNRLLQGIGRYYETASSTSNVCAENPTPLQLANIVCRRSFSTRP